MNHLNHLAPARRIIQAPLAQTTGIKREGRHSRPRVLLEPCLPNSGFHDRFRVACVPSEWLRCLLRAGIARRAAFQALVERDK